MVHGSWDEFLKDLRSCRTVFYDTTLRDGAQTPGVNFSLDDKLALARRLDSFGFHYIEAGWPSTGPVDAGLFKKLACEKFTARIAAFGMTSARPAHDPQIGKLLDSGAGTLTIFGKASESHAREVLKVSAEENISMIGETVDFLKSHGREVFFDAEHFFDSYKTGPDYAIEAAGAAKSADCIVLCDTNGGLMPWEADRICRAAKARAKTLGIHCHNDSGSAVMNSLIALAHGFCHIQGTVNGLGERCGNTDWCELLPALRFKAGAETPDLAGLYPLSLYVERMTGFTLQPNKPYVGANAFAHKAGVHIDAAMKTGSAYEHVPPESVGNRRIFSFSEQSGRSAVITAAKNHGLSLVKDDKIVGEVTEALKAGRGATDAEVYTMLMRKSGAAEHFRVLDYTVSVSSSGAAQASVEMEVGSEQLHEISRGVGPVHALDLAIRKALGRFYDVKDVCLKNYRVRILNQEKATAASVEVFIEFSRNGISWSTVGISDDIIRASGQALIKGYEYYLLRCERK